MLRWRLTLGAVLIAALVGLCWLDWHATRPGIVLLPLAIVVATLAAGELLVILRRRGHEPLAWAVYLGTLSTVLAAAVPGLWPGAAELPIQGVGWIAVGLVASLLLALVGELHRYDGARHATLDLSLAVFAVAYVGGLIGFLVQLRLFGGGDGHLGMLALVSLIAIVKLSDVGQYTAGRLFGKHKLAPTVSPGKTWEGLAGGVLFGCIGAWFVLRWCAPRLIADGMLAGATQWGGSNVQAIGYSLLLVAAGLIGDLAESLLKRDAGMKDSSTWMPGFGGVLDLLDSLLGAAPVAYVLWALGWIGP
jgi:phosphatidate cytidylyltransferase